MLKADSLEPQFIFFSPHCFDLLVPIENIEMLMNNLCINFLSLFIYFFTISLHTSLKYEDGSNFYH